MNPKYGRVRTTDSYVDGKIDWTTIYLEETVRLNTVDDLLNPAIDLIGKMKNGHSNEFTMTAKKTPQGITVTKTHLIIKEKK